MKKYIFLLLLLLSCKQKVSVPAEVVAQTHTCVYTHTQISGTICIPNTINNITTIICNPTYSTTYKYENGEGIYPTCINANHILYFTKFKLPNNKELPFKSSGGDAFLFSEKKNVILIVDEKLETIYSVH